MGEKIMYDTIFARSFSKYEQKKLGYAAFLGCLLVALSFCTVFKPYLGPLSVLNMDVGLKMLKVTDSSVSSLKQSANDTSNSLTTMIDKTSRSDIEMVVDNNDTSSSSKTIISNDTINFNLALALPMVVNDTISSSNITINDSFSSNKPLPADDAQDGTRRSSNMSAEINNTSNVTLMSKDVIISTMSLPSVVVDDIDRSTSSEPNLKINNKNTSHQVHDSNRPEIRKPICKLEGRTEVCEMKGDIRIDGKTSTVILVASSASSPSDNSSWIISPYARRGDEEASSRVKKWSVKSGVGANAEPQCGQNHKVPAIIFSLGGYAGNNFHDFTDIVIPLYLTCRQFNGEVKFVITNYNPWWIHKFQNVLQKLSRYELIDIDKEETIHCFQSVIVGLKRETKELKIDPSKSPNSMNDFKQFLRSAYSLKRDTAIKLRENGRKRRPRLLIIARKRTRAFTNTNEIARMATRLGFKVVVTEVDSHVPRVAETVNSCDVMMGVHGAGLTNMVFLPDNAILIQILPFGNFQWLAKTDFGEPSKDMNIRYLDYEIKTQESTLIQQYPAEHEVFSNPSAIGRRGWYAFKSIYLEQQNVKLDINRFRPTLLKALELLRH